MVQPSGTAGVKKEGVGFKKDDAGFKMEGTKNSNLIERGHQKCTAEKLSKTKCLTPYIL
jgi:hypothetical protein